MISKRQKIVDEVLTRLNTYFSENTDLPEAERGKLDISNTDYPFIYIYEDMEEGVKEHHNNTIFTLPIQIDIGFRSYNNVYEDGNVILTQVKEAMELDRDFGGTCYDYCMVAKFIDIMLDPLAKVSVVYEFKYYEFFGINGLEE